MREEKVTLNYMVKTHGMYLCDTTLCDIIYTLKFIIHNDDDCTGGRTIKNKNQHGQTGERHRHLQFLFFGDSKVGNMFLTLASESKC